MWPTLWYLVVASRPLGIWLGLWGIPLTAGSIDPTDGNVVDRYFFIAMTILGLRILARRRFDWGGAIRRNPWLVALLGFMLLSIVWSDFPFVSFKRFIKVIGSVVMAFVILSSVDPLAAFTTVLRRCLYIHLPMSIICTRYFRNIGVAYEYNGRTQEWIGIATSKNTLGQVTMLGVLYFSWQVWANWKKVGWKNIDLLYLLMALFLLKGAESISVTSLSVSILALFIFLRIQYLRRRPLAIPRFVRVMFYGTLTLVAFVVVHGLVYFSEDSFFGHIITLLGRDITLTGRTGIWHDVYAVAARSPLVGIGYGGFWIGRIANIPWNAHMTWVLGQAHSGYVDTYLQLGFVGAILLAGVIISTLPRLLASLAGDFDFACLRIALFITIIFVNMTESVYLRGDHHLWLILMVVLWDIPRGKKASKPRSAEPSNANIEKDPLTSIPSRAGVDYRGW